MRHWQPCNCDGIRNRVTSTFDLLTSGSMHAERVLWTVRVPSLVLITQAVFMLERGQTDRQTDASECPTHTGGYAGVSNNV